MQPRTGLPDTTTRSEVTERMDLATAQTLAFVRSKLPSGTARVLEVGCGNRRLASALQAGGLTVVAIDSSDRPQ